MHENAVALEVRVSVTSKEARELLKRWREKGEEAGGYIVLGQLHIPDAADRRWLMRVGLVLGKEQGWRAGRSLAKACGITREDQYARFETDRAGR